MRKHVVVANCRLPLRNVGPPLLGLPLALEPQGAGVAAVSPTRTPSHWAARRLPCWRPKG